MEESSVIIPLGPYGSYPNPLDLTESDRASFHPVVQFPRSLGEDGKEVSDYEISDFTRRTLTRQLATSDERTAKHSAERPAVATFSVGRYDEDRKGLYESDHFDDLENAIDGYSGRRTVHVGIDLGGPVGTAVHAFSDGIIHSLGYNAPLGDYGHVIVICHLLGNGRKVYALYGHLSAKSIEGRKSGDAVARGEVIGCMGDFHENGGWFFPHVHFQLAIHEPETHDMPGAVSRKDRLAALVHYPDPRYVLGPLY